MRLPKIIRSTKLDHLLAKATEKGRGEGYDEYLRKHENSKPSPLDAFSNGVPISAVLSSLKEDTSLIPFLRDADLMGQVEERAIKAMKQAEKKLFGSIKESIGDIFTTFWTGVSFDTARLYRIQQRVAQMYREDNLIHSIGMLLQRYVIGTGVTFSVGNPEVDEYLRLFWSEDGVNMERRQKEIALHRYLLGEYPLVYFIGKGTIGIGDHKLPDMSIRKFYPWEITKMLFDEDDDELLYGMVRNDGDGKPCNYRLISAYLQADRFKNKVKTPEDGAYVQYVKLGDGFDQRGYPQVYPLLRWATIIRELMYDISSKFHEWSKVLYLLTVTRKDKDWTSDTGRRAPKGGTILVNSPDAKWEIAESRMDAQGINIIWEVLMYYFSGGAGFPYQYIVHDYSNNNLASSREARVPFNQLIHDQQDSLGPEFKTVLRTALKSGVDAKILKPRIKVPSIIEGVTVSERFVKILRDVDDYEERVFEITKLIRENSKDIEVDTVYAPMILTFPRVPAMSEEEQSKIAERYRGIGIDMHTISDMIGLDWATLKARKLAEVDFESEIHQRRMQKGQSDDGVVPDGLEGD